ncbi:MAG: glutathione S-transferase, partial [Myxococcota bacterium]
IANWSWVSLHGWAGVETDDLPHLSRWKDTVKARPGVQRGRAVPVAAEPSDANAEEVAKSGRKILA